MVSEEPEAELRISLFVVELYPSTVRPIRRLAWLMGNLTFF